MVDAASDNDTIFSDLLQEPGQTSSKQNSDRRYIDDSDSIVVVPEAVRLLTVNDQLLFACLGTGGVSVQFCMISDIKNGNLLPHRECFIQEVYQPASLIEAYANLLKPCQVSTRTDLRPKLYAVVSSEETTDLSTKVFSIPKQYIAAVFGNNVLLTESTVILVVVNSTVYAIDTRREATVEVERFYSQEHPIFGLDLVTVVEKPQETDDSLLFFRQKEPVKHVQLCIFGIYGQAVFFHRTASNAILYCTNNLPGPIKALQSNQYGLFHSDGLRLYVTKLSVDAIMTDLNSVPLSFYMARAIGSSPSKCDSEGRFIICNNSFKLYLMLPCVCLN